MTTRRRHEELVAAAVDALMFSLVDFDIEVESVTRALTADTPFDALVDVSVDGSHLPLGLTQMAYCTGQSARELVNRLDRSPLDVYPILVAERITVDGRQLLAEARWSWLDRRGRIFLWWPQVRISTDVPATGASTATGSIQPAIRGRSGVSVAYWLLENPHGSLSPTRLRGELALAPSSISTAARRLSDAGLVDDGGRPVIPELFWELAAVWRPERAWVLDSPAPADYMRPEAEGTAWRRSGSAAAAAWGAPVVTSGPGPVELYIGGPVELSIARRRYGTASPGAGGAVLSVAPTGLVLTDTPRASIPVVGGWRVAPKVAVALDLAQDLGRGRQILDEWDDVDAVWR